MHRPPRPLPDALSGVFTAAEARRLGVSARRLGFPDVVRLARGIYTRSRAFPFDEGQAQGLGQSRAEIWQQRQRRLAMLVAPVLPVGLFFAGRTAAALWRLPVPPPAGAELGRTALGRTEPRNAALDLGGLDIACCSARSGRLSAGLNLTRVHPDHINVVNHFGVSLTDPASTWAMLAPRLGRDDAVALGDAVIREARIPGTTRLERPPHATIADLAALAAMPYRAGRQVLHECLPLLSPHAASAPESHLRLKLEEWRVPPPQLDYDVYSEGGLLLGCSEFAFPEYRLALEYEGSHHHSETRQWNRDIDKYHAYAQAGWEPFRVTADHLYRRRLQLRDLIFQALRRRGWEGSQV